MFGEAQCTYCRQTGRSYGRILSLVTAHISHIVFSVDILLLIAYLESQTNAQCENQSAALRPQQEVAGWFGDSLGRLGCVHFDPGPLDVRDISYRRNESTGAASHWCKCPGRQSIQAGP